MKLRFPKIRKLWKINPRSKIEEDKEIVQENTFSD